MYGAYLRKSRADLELEKNSGINTLKRHKDIIINTAKSLNITIDTWWQEVVSGDTIEDRPEVQKMLLEVEKGNYDGILVVDIDRLARGDTADQARISKCFLYSNTKIITPNKIYDPNNEDDEEYFEFNLFMARREYKTINKRLNRGRLSSVNEGKFVGSVCPYGYTKEKLKKEKGYKLVPLKEEADIIKIIFEKACENMGSQNIANYLNSIGSKPRKNDEWSCSTIRDIIRNPVYYGMIKWNWRRTEKKMVNGIIYKSRPKHEDYILVKGLHKPLITKHTFDKANKNSKSKNGKTLKKDDEVKNPLMGLVHCAVCGRTMQRRNYRSGHIDGLICPKPHCKNIGSHLYLVEEKIIQGLNSILTEYELIIKNYKGDNNTNDSCNDSSLNIIEVELAKLHQQLNKAYDLLEQEIYDSNTFLERSKLLKDEINKLEKERKKIETTHKKKNINKIKELIPNIKYVLNNYNDNLSAEEKNNLLKSIISRVEYLKVKKGRGHEDDFTLRIYTKI